MPPCLNALLTRPAEDQSRQSVSIRRRTRATACYVVCSALSHGKCTDPLGN